MSAGRVESAVTGPTTARTATRDVAGATLAEGEAGRPLATEKVAAVAEADPSKEVALVSCAKADASYATSVDTLRETAPSSVEAVAWREEVATGTGTTTADRPLEIGRRGTTIGATAVRDMATEECRRLEDTTTTLVRRPAREVTEMVESAIAAASEHLSRAAETRRRNREDKFNKVDQ